MKKWVPSIFYIFLSFASAQKVEPSVIFKEYKASKESKLCDALTVVDSTYRGKSFESYKFPFNPQMTDNLIYGLFDRNRYLLFRSLSPFYGEFFYATYQSPDKKVSFHVWYDRVDKFQSEVCIFRFDYP